MPNTREKLIELIQSAVDGCATYWAGLIADHLIANGVTVQKWIPVSEPPKERGDYLCYYKYEPQMPDAVCENTYYGKGRWMSDGDKVTHWMPLPQPPKENYYAQV